MLKSVSGIVFIAVCGLAAAEASAAGIGQTDRRKVTLEDLALLRTVDSLSVSPDARRYAIRVRQADSSRNEYRTAWFAGGAQGGKLIRLGDGGQVRPRVMHTGHVPGALAAGDCLWSPDGQWIAYTLRGDDGVQLWRSRVDGSLQEQLTHDAADIRQFAWSEDGAALYFSVGTPRAELRAQEQSRAWQGYRYDEDLLSFTDFLGPQMLRPLETNLSTWLIGLEDRRVRPGGEAGQAALARAWARHASIHDMTKISGAEAAITRLSDDHLRLCSQAGADRLICVRETASLPAHVVTVDLRSARSRPQLLADVNPQWRNMRIGKVERFEWDNPKFAWNEPGGALAGLYPKRTYGYILYPPDFNPAKKYPVFIDPYIASGFDPLGAEHPLHVYAANEILVLRMEFPRPVDLPGQDIGMQDLYSFELGFPHLNMLMESTLRGLDAVVARGFIDERRVGIGGVSHGTFVPLYLMQKHDRIAAISISSPSWGPLQRYGSTRKSRDMLAAFGLTRHDWAPAMEGNSEFWSKLDIADNVDTLEAPVLMHLAAHETFAMVRLIRNLADAGKPYDAYIFPEETHIKWQPAHLAFIMSRNLDWFRFWLQDAEDPNPAKAEQYRRWRKLREP
jgi:dipeptidyl aminopeptidase/acylaminoacyl peptidase